MGNGNGPRAPGPGGSGQLENHVDSPLNIPEIGAPWSELAKSRQAAKIRRRIKRALTSLTDDVARAADGLDCRPVNSNSFDYCYKQISRAQEECEIILTHIRDLARWDADGTHRGEP